MFGNAWSLSMRLHLIHESIAYAIRFKAMLYPCGLNAIDKNINVMHLKEVTLSIVTYLWTRHCLSYVHGEDIHITKVGNHNIHIIKLYNLAFTHASFTKVQLLTMLMWVLSNTSESLSQRTSMCDTLTNPQQCKVCKSSYTLWKDHHILYIKK